MRFFISSNIKSNKPIYISVVFFLLSTLLFWTLSWLTYHLKYGLSYERVFLYFFTDPRFPEKLPLGQLLEDIHIQLFIQLTFVLVIASIFVHKCVKEKVKFVLVALSFLALITELLFSLGIYFLSPLFIYLKLFSFIIFQLSTGTMLFLSLKLYLSREKEEPPERSILYSLVFMFSLTTLIFALLNFFLFIIKFGITPDGVAEYYVGNPTKFIRAKSLEGVLEVFVPHLITMAIYLFALVHFAFFTNSKRKVLIAFLTFSFALVDNGSGLLIRFLSPDFAVLKLLSFLGLTAMMVYISLLVALSILRHRAKAIIVL